MVDTLLKHKRIIKIQLQEISYNMMSRLRYHNTIYFMAIHIYLVKIRISNKNAHFMKIILSGIEGRANGLGRV